MLLYLKIIFYIFYKYVQVGLGNDVHNIRISSENESKRD